VTKFQTIQFHQSSVTLTLVRASVLAWLSISSNTTPVRPHLLATCSGAMSFYSTAVKSQVCQRLQPLAVSMLIVTAVNVHPQ